MKMFVLSNFHCFRIYFSTYLPRNNLCSLLIISIFAFRKNE